MGRAKTGKERKEKKFLHPFNKNTDFSLQKRKIRGFEIIQKIAKGAFGKVYKAKSKDGDLCALKFVDLNDAENKRNFQLECDLAAMLSSEGIGPKFIGSWTMPTAKMAVLATQLWDTTLEQYLGANKQKNIPKLVLQKIKGQLKRLHATGHVHLDIHSGNVLLKLNNSKIIDATLTDFGKTTHKDGINQKVLDDAIKFYELEHSTDPVKIDQRLLEKMISEK